MPYVNIRLLEGPTKEQKAQIVKEVTDTLVRVLGKNPASTHVVIDEVARENWAVGGELVSERKPAPPKA